MLASDELVAAPVEPYSSDSSWLVVESEAADSACSIAELPAVVPDALASPELLDADEVPGVTDELEAIAGAEAVDVDAGAVFVAAAAAAVEAL
ncbi:MAG: hypothetical protein ACRDL5_12220 [Solirubrobacteraceae bacterium]